MSKQTPLAIVGIGCLFPKASGMKEYWSNLKAKVDAIEEIPASHWTPEDYFDKDKAKPDMTYARRGGFLNPVEFDPAEYGIAPNALEATDSAQLLGLVAAGMAMKDAGYGPDREFDRNKVSVILGVTGSLELVIPLGARLGHPIWRKALLEAGIPAEQAEGIVEKIKDGYVPWQEASFPGLLGNVVAGRIANRFNLGGTNCVVDAACASSLSAAHLAALELQAGRTDMVVTGGVDCFNDIFMYMCFSKTPALSPTGNSKPFDKKADGTILGEGLGMVVLKRLADAERDGDKIYAVLKGVGSSSDGRGKSIYAPSAAGQVKALRKAYDNADVSAATVELVEAHGTGTSVGDGVEVEALSEVYREAGAGERVVALGSVKSMIGHTKAAAGAAGLIKVALGLHHKVLPPTIKVDDPLDVLKKDGVPFYLNTEKRPWVGRGHPRRAAVSALGFGGSNFHAVVEEYKREKTEIDWDARVEVIALSGADEAALDAGLEPFKSAKTWAEVRGLGAQTRAAFKATDACRLTLVVELGKTDLPKLAASAAAQLRAKKGENSWTLPDGAFFGRGAAGKVAVLFPGQGSQYVGMLRDLACAFPQSFAALEAANGVFGEKDGERLSDLMYPAPAFSADEREAQETALRSTDVAQPALGAAGLGAWRTLSEAFGLSADAFAGHSYGELAALCAAGAFDEAALQSLSKRRGELMAAGDGGRGAMLAVVAPLADCEKLLAEERLDLVIANKNAPAQNVLSGKKEEIERAAKACEARKLKAVRLPVSAAFHSPLVAGAQEGFAETLGRTAFAAPLKPVYANTTAKPYPSDAKQARATLAGQLAAPVAFAELVGRMHDDGCRVFVECGAGARLSGLVGQILTGKPFAAVALDASNGKRSGQYDLAACLGRLAALGVSVNLSTWEGGDAVLPSKSKRMTVKLTGMNHRSTPAKAKPVKVALPQAQAPAAPAPQAYAPAPAAAPAGFVSDAILALQRMQEQTAHMHLKFLEAQEAAQRSLQAMIDAQAGRAPMPAPTYPQTRFETSPAAIAMPVVPQPAIVAQPVPAQPKPAAAAPASNVEQVLLAVVSEKTGYPAETLNFDMDLESDLGIDSIKRVEILSALSEKLPGAPKVEPKHIGTLRTLRQIGAYLGSAAPATSSPKSTETDTTSSRTSPAPQSAVEPILLSVVSEKTGYPAETLNFDMDLESDLGIDSIKRVEILSALSEKLPGAPKVEPKHIGTLRTLRQIAAHLAAPSSSPSKSTETATTLPGTTTAPQSAVEPILLSVVSEKTGYPADTLNFDMDLESDLGIDSIKRVEILSALSEKLPNAPKVEPKHIGTLRTLRQIAAYLGQGAATYPQNRPGTEMGTTSTSSADVDAALLSVVSEKTGYPAETLNVDMDLESDLGIDSIKRVEILSALSEKLPSAPKVEPKHIGTLRTLRQIAAHLTAGQAPAAQPESPAKSWPSPSTSTGTPAEPQQELPCERMALKAVELGGEHRGALSLSSAPLWLAGDNQVCSELSKLLSKAGLSPVVVDLNSPAAAPEKLAGLVVVAPVRKLAAGALWDAESENFLKGALMLAQRAARSLGEGSAFFTVSRLDGAFGLNGLKAEQDPCYGGLSGLSKTASHEWANVACRALDVDSALDAKAAAAAIAEELAVRGPLELGVSANGARTTLKTLRLETSDAKPGASPLAQGDLVLVTGGARGVTAEAAAALAPLKPVLALWGRTPLKAEEAHLASAATEAELKRAILSHPSTKSLSPKAAGALCREVLANREVRATLERLEKLGATVAYEAVDVREPAQVAAALSRLQGRFGPVRAVVHGAGVLADKLIADKSAETSAPVFETKLAGLRNVLAALGGSALKALCLFSSTTARFGRTGQSDYAMANEALNKAAQLLSRRLGGCRVVSINWGPWDGGMVTDALKPLFAKEGVGLIGKNAGGKFLVDELASDTKAVEVTCLAKLPGQDKAELAIAAKLEASLEKMPILSSHVIAGKPVVPFALTLEWLAHAALHANPGLSVAGFDDARVLKGVRLEKAAALELSAGKAIKKDGVFQVRAEVRGAGGAPLHAGATVALANKLEAAPKAIAALPGAAPRTLDYPSVLFHGPDLRLLTKVLAVTDAGIDAECSAAPAPARWLREPLRDRWLVEPAALDAAFQAMIVWTVERLGAPSLPTRVGKLRQYRAWPAEGVTLRARVTKTGSGAAAADMDFVARDGSLVARVEGYEATVDASLAAAFRS